MNRSLNEIDGLEKLVESLIKMVGRTNERMDGITKRIYQLEIAAKEQQVPRVYSFIADSNKD